MNKEAKTGSIIHDLLKRRWSPRAFSDKTVEDEKLLKILEAARWSPSASNLQPWYFIVGFKDDETYGKIYDTLVEFNQLWAKFAPILIMSIGKKTIKDTTDKNSTFKYDVGQSVAHLTFQAMAEGLFVHQMSGFDIEKARKLFEIPDDYQALTVIAAGYPGNYNLLPPRMQKSELAERERKALNTFIFSEIFGKTSNLVES